MPKGLHIRDSGIYDRIMSFRAKGEDVAVFARRVGLRRTTVQHWIDKTQNGIGLVNVQRFVEATDVSYDWLIIGREEPAMAGTRVAAKQAVGEIQTQLEHLDSILSRAEVTDT